jgi:hypothetical protein
MSKLFVIIGATLLLVASGIYAANPEIFEGGWKDGTSVKWICPPKTSGAIPFQFTTKEGVVYQGILSCGESV